MSPPLPYRRAWRLSAAAGLLFTCLFTACQGQSAMSHQPVPAERYFATSPALPVAQACQHDDADGVTQALATTRASPDAVGEQGMSLLLLAMSNRSKKAVRALLQHGANPNLRTELGGRNKLDVQPVGLAAGGDDSEMLRLLLEHGGDPNSRYNEDPAIFNARPDDDNKGLGLLLDHGADVDAVDKHGDPLLVSCALLRQFDRVVYLIKRGADVHKPGEMGNTVAYELQDQGFDFAPGERLYPWVTKAKQLLEAKGIRFPVPDPRVAHRARVRAENAQRRQWEATPAGRRLVKFFQDGERARELGQPSPDYTAMLNQRVEAEHAFQAWRKTQPNWSRPTGIWADKSSLYPVPTPTLASEAAEEARRKMQDQADSTRWAEQSRIPRQ